MATLTYDPSEAQEGELSAEEQDSLKVGEALAEQEGKKLAGKFEDAEALEKAYIELQSKLGEPKEEKAPVKEEKTEAKEEVKETKEEEKPDYSSFLDDLWTESQNEKYSDELLDKLNDLKPGDVAQLYLNYRANAKEDTTDLTTEQATELQQSVGGEKKYTEMLKWASDNFDEAENRWYLN